jgi:ferredoxin
VTARYRIKVDPAVCQGSGLCAGIAPEHFKVGDDYRSRPLREVVDANEHVRDAAECCPLEAITLTDADTGQPVL